MVRAELDVVEHVTGERPHTCPWWSFRVPDVTAVLHAYDFFESGQLSEWWGTDPEWWAVEGVRYYHRALGRARVDAIKTERAAPKGPPVKRLPHVEHTING